jgi:hypothetical protein
MHNAEEENSDLKLTGIEVTLGEAATKLRCAAANLNRRIVYVLIWHFEAPWSSLSRYCGDSCISTVLHASACHLQGYLRPRPRRLLARSFLLLSALPCPDSRAPPRLPHTSAAKESARMN